MALSTSEERYCPSDSWLYIYADNSAVDGVRDATAGVYDQYFTIVKAVGVHCSNFDGEAGAISLALEAIKNGSEANIVLFIDSEATIITITTIFFSRSLNVLITKVQLIIWI